MKRALEKVNEKAQITSEASDRTLGSAQDLQAEYKNLSAVTDGMYEILNGAKDEPRAPNLTLIKSEVQLKKAS